MNNDDLDKKFSNFKNSFMVPPERHSLFYIAVYLEKIANELEKLNSSKNSGVDNGVSQSPTVGS